MNIGYMARIKDCVSTMVSAGSQYIDGTDITTNNDLLDIREFAVHKKFLMGLEVNYEELLPLYYHFIENYMLNGAYDTFEISAFTADDIDELIVTVDATLKGELLQFMDNEIFQEVSNMVQTEGYTNTSKVAVKLYKESPDSKEDMMNEYIENKVKNIKDSYNSNSIPFSVILECLANVVGLGNQMISRMVNMGFSEEGTPLTEEDSINFLKKSYSTLKLLNKPVGNKLFSWVKNDGTLYLTGRVLNILEKLSYSLEAYIHAWNTLVVELSEGSCSSLGKYSSIVINRVYALNMGKDIIGIRIGTATRYVDINIEVATKLGIQEKWSKKLKVTKVGNEYLTKKEVSHEIQVQDISEDTDLCSILAEKILEAV